MKVQAQKVNSFLGVFNFLLLIAIVGMLVYMFYENEKEKGRGNMVFIKEGAELKMYVVEDNVLNGYLDNKLVRVISLNPLYLEVLPQNVQIGKNGSWGKEIYNSSAKVKNTQQPFIYIKGKRQ